jgi:hypothetical protein
MLGSITRPKQWRCPLNQKGDAVTKVSFSNKKMRLATDNIAHLVDFVFSSPDDTELNTEEDINNFQSKIDDFFTAYVEKSGAEKKGYKLHPHVG